MFQQNSISIKRRFFLPFIFLTSTLFASYHPIYDLENPQFEYALENGNYKVYLIEEESIDYNSTNGFELFLPNFLKEYNLGVLRFNSIGTIDGILSTKQNELEPSKNIGFDEMKYYLTDYATANQRQLNYLLKNEKIPYFNKTSLAFQGYNIPKNIATNLNKWIFFSFLNNDKENKLTTLVYSYSMILDKKLVDNYVQKNKKILKYEKDETFNYLHTYLSSFGKRKEKNKNTHKIQLEDKMILDIIPQEINYEKNGEMEQTLKESKRLDLRRELEMKDLQYADNENRNNIKKSEYEIKDNYEALQK